MAIPAGLIQAAVAGVAHAGDGYALADGAFSAGAQRVSGLEVLGVRGGPGGELRLVHLPGNRSRTAAKFLGRSGREAVNHTGGMRAWQAAGLPLVGPRRPTRNRDLSGPGQ